MLLRTVPAPINPGSLRPPIEGGTTRFSEKPAWFLKNLQSLPPYNDVRVLHYSGAWARRGIILQKRYRPRSIRARSALPIAERTIRFFGKPARLSKKSFGSSAGERGQGMAQSGQIHVFCCIRLLRPALPGSGGGYFIADMLHAIRPVGACPKKLMLYHT
jgi:hypothetical protein